LGRQSWKICHFFNFGHNTFYRIKSLAGSAAKILRVEYQFFIVKAVGGGGLGVKTLFDLVATYLKIWVTGR
jgi:hypothetical protein